MLKRSARARAMRLSVFPDSRVIVTAPIFLGTGAVENFVERHTAWIHKHLRRTMSKSVIRIPRNDITRLKRNALALAQGRCMHFAKYYGFSYNRISIRAQKLRWGSCSSAGNLSFNYRIAVLPPQIADYVVVHELCHLAEMNHSGRFWTLVARAVPDHKRVRKELRNIIVSFS